MGEKGECGPKAKGRGDKSSCTEEFDLKTEHVSLIYNDYDKEAIYAFVIFRSMEGVRLFNSAYKHNNYKKFDGNWLKV